jgi:membrane-bound inhibitor of C-type lysozyme
MNKKYIFITAAVIVILAAAGVALFMMGKSSAPAQPATLSSAASSTLNTVVFQCDNNKSITAGFDMANDAQVQLALSDGRQMSLPHAVSADGARYANSDESIVFWNVGTTAFMQENGTTTFANCAIQDNPAAATTTVTYRNNTYGFLLNYPQGLTPTTTFARFYALADGWRAEAPDGEKGTGAVSIPVFRVDQGGVATGKPYPLYFDAEVRVGVSADPQAVADCLKPDPGYASEPNRQVTLGGVQFEEFDFQDAAMMQYLQGESYRVVHNNMCFAIEQIRTGSDYRDDTMTAGIVQTQLDAYYAQAGVIAQSFQFTKACMAAFLIAIVVLCLLVPALVAGNSLAPWVPSRNEDVEAALDLAGARAGEVFYDLGCGEGHALFLAARRGLRAIGVELAPLLFFAARVRTMFARVAPGSVAVRYGNLFRTDISDADIIFVYGLPRALRGPFAAKLQREAKEGTRVVSCRFHIRPWQEKAVAYSAKGKQPVYLYEI